MAARGNPLQIGDDGGNALSLAPWQVGDPTDPMAVAGAQTGVADPLSQWLAAMRAKSAARSGMRQATAPPLTEEDLYNLPVPTMPGQRRGYQRLLAPLPEGRSFIDRLPPAVPSADPRMVAPPLEPDQPMPSRGRMPPGEVDGWLEALSRQRQQRGGLG